MGNMSETEKERTATVFRSIVDEPAVDEVVDMEDEVFENNERADLQNDKNDPQNDKREKNEATPPKKRRGRPRKCRSLGSLSSTPDLEKLLKPSKKLPKRKKIIYPCAICNDNVPFGIYSVQCCTCSLWVHLRCSGLKSVKEHDEDYSCSKCNNTNENTRDTIQQTLQSKGSRARIPSSTCQNKKRNREGEPVKIDKPSTDKINKSKKKEQKDKNVDVDISIITRRTSILSY